MASPATSPFRSPSLKRAGCQSARRSDDSLRSPAGRVVLNPLSALGSAQRVDRSRPGVSVHGGATGRPGGRGELAGTGLPPPERGGLKGYWRESRCQAAIRTLRATADLAAFVLPLRCLTSR